MHIPIPYTDFSVLGRLPDFPHSEAQLKFFRKLHLMGAERTRTVVHHLGEEDVARLVDSQYLLHREHPALGDLITLGYNGRAALGLRRDYLTNLTAAADELYRREGVRHLVQTRGLAPLGYHRDPRRLMQLRDAAGRVHLAVGRIGGGSGYSAPAVRAILREWRPVLWSTGGTLIVLHPDLRRVAKVAGYYGQVVDVQRFPARRELSEV